MDKKSFLNNKFLQREFLAVFIVVVNTFSWYFPLYFFFENILRKIPMEFTSLLATYGIHYVMIIAFALIGTALVKRFPSREAFLSVWMFIGIIASALMVALETVDTAYIWLVSFILGSSLGLGLPSGLAYFGDHSTEEIRGRLGGITFLASGLCIFLVGLLISFSTLIVGVMILAMWRGLGLVLFLLVRPKEIIRKENAAEVSYKSILLDKSFLLYLIPWIMFCLINFLETPVASILFGAEIASLVPIAEYGIGGLTALIGGWFADSVGRKRVIVFAFIMLGIGYAVLGLFPSVILSWYVYIILDGFAWGIFSLMFFMVIWSELAGNRVKEKYYLIGVLPWLISAYIQMLFTPFAELIAVSAAFSLASFFLFLAVFPLMYATETLPDKKIEIRRLKGYVEQAKKTRDKYVTKRGAK